MFFRMSWKTHLIFTETIIDAPKAENGVDVWIWDRVSGLKKNLMLAAILKDIWSKIFIESEPVDKEEQDDDLEGAVFHLGGAFDSLIGV